jgi:hypothetical protein
MLYFSDVFRATLDIRQRGGIQLAVDHVDNRVMLEEKYHA